MNINDIKLLLDKEMYLELNDSIAQTKLESIIPNTICNQEINTPNVIDNNCIRFIMNDQLYEYGPNKFFTIEEWLNGNVENMSKLSVIETVYRINN